MLKAICIYSILYYSLSIVYGQNYIPFRNCLNEAEYWFYEEQFDSALVYYKKAEQFNYKFYPKDAHLYSRTLWELGFEKKALHRIKKDGLSDIFIHDTSYYHGLSPEKRAKFSEKLRSSNMLPSPSKDFIDTLRKMDQKYRNIPDSVKQDTIKFKIALERMAKMDDTVRTVFLRYIKENGFPGGYIHTDVVFEVILLHAGEKWIFEHLDFFLIEIKQGRMNPRSLSRSLDRFFTHKDCPKLRPYNTYVGSDIGYSVPPEAIFFNSCLIGLNPYFENPDERIFSRGKSPKKSKLYDYYKSNKTSFNCIRFN